MLWKSVPVTILFHVLEVNKMQRNLLWNQKVQTLQNEDSLMAEKLLLQGIDSDSSFNICWIEISLQNTSPYQQLQVFLCKITTILSCIVGLP